MGGVESSPQWLEANTKYQCSLPSLHLTPASNLILLVPTILRDGSPTSIAEIVPVQ